MIASEAIVGVGIVTSGVISTLGVPPPIVGTMTGGVGVVPVDAGGVLVGVGVGVAVGLVPP